MNKKLLALSFLLSSALVPEAIAQQVPNPGFESWKSASYEIPDIVPPVSAFTNSNNEVMAFDKLNATKIPNGFGHALRLETVTYNQGKDTSIAYAVWGATPRGDGMTFPGGFPFTDQNVTGIKADLRYTINPSSPGFILVQFKKNGAPIGGDLATPGFYAIPVSGTQSTFATMTFPFSQSLPQAPDSVVIAFISNNGLQEPRIGYPGNFLEIDNIAFTGTTQTVIGGDLDSWTMSNVFLFPEDWKLDQEDDYINHVSTDAHAGLYALSLTVKDYGNNNIQNPGVRIGTAVYTSQNNPPIYLPGMKVTDKPQSLGFFYKYTTTGSDQATVHVVLTKWNGTGRTVISDANHSLTASSGYKYEYILMNTVNAGIPDSAYIEFRASNNYPNFTNGSELLLDDVQFNYCDEPLMISGNATVCPNATGVAYSISPTPGSTYTWTLPSGATIASGSGTNAITVDFTTNFGNVEVVKTYVDGCAPRTVTKPVSQQATASANAGSNFSVCAGEIVNLNGTVEGAGGGHWTTSGGGTFANADALVTTYTPNIIDRMNETVTLTLTTTNSGTCSPVSHNITIGIPGAPTVSAGQPQNICATNTATLEGDFINSTGGVWSGGTGSFSPDNTDPNAVYTPSVSEKNAGSVTLIWTSTGHASVCPTASDQVTITIMGEPIANAGSDQNGCSNDPAVTLNASQINALGGTWSGGSGTFTPNETTSNATYTPSAAELVAGAVNLTWTTTGYAAGCNPNSDVMQITYSICTGILGAASANELKVYPSPSNAIVTVEAMTEIEKVSVLNTLQQEVAVKVIDINGKTATLDISGLHNGVYFLQITNGKNSGIQKIVKE